MQLTLWTYEGPPHVGAMRIATAMKGVHYVLHAPQGDTYADLLFTMIERRQRAPAGHLHDVPGARPGRRHRRAVQDRGARGLRALPAGKAMLVGASCTAELIQDDPGGLAQALDLPIPVVPLELPAYQRKENWGAAETFYRLVRTLADRRRSVRAARAIRRPAALQHPGPHRARLPPPRRRARDHGGCWSGSASTSTSSRRWAQRRPTWSRLGDADFNIVLYPESRWHRGQWLKRTFGQPATKIVPLGVGATRDFIAEVARSPASIRPARTPGWRRFGASQSRLPWYARSVDSHLSHRQAGLHLRRRHPRRSPRPAIAAEELGFEVVGLGTYSREFAREVRAAAKAYGLDSADHRRLPRSRSQGGRGCSPNWCWARRWSAISPNGLGIPCAVISAPVHVQDFPARYCAADGFRGCQRPVRHLGPSADDGARGASAAPCSATISSSTTPPRLRIWGMASRRRCPEAAVTATEPRPTRRPRPFAEPSIAPKLRAGPTPARGCGWAPTASASSKQDSLFRPRQGAAQHRALRQERGLADHHGGDSL